MRLTLSSLAVFFILLVFNSCTNKEEYVAQYNLNELVIRIAQVEIDTDYYEEYHSILKEEAEASARLESGVISIFPMHVKDSPEEIMILEIYANQSAYESHLTTSHFLKYKTSTQNMVKSLRLIDMESIDKPTMSRIFTKLKL